MKTAKTVRCEGWRRYGGAFTFGPVRWEQCKNDAVVNLKVRQEGEVQEMPGCMECWNEAIENSGKIEILEAKPIDPK